MIKSAHSTMTTTLYHRNAMAILHRYAAIYPAVSLQGPRQSGKTTLARLAFPSHPYVSLEDLSVQQQIADDPHSFIAKYKNGAIFDEVQNAPSLLSYLQEVIDMSDETGRFIITGSQNFVISQTVSQSLAGRVGQITLLPLALSELKNTTSFMHSIVHGGYPRLYKHAMEPHEFYPSYIDTYIQRDVRQILNVQNLSLFKKFLTLCAGRVGRLFNASEVARDCGISPRTAEQWVSVLEASYTVFLLRPYHTNFNKRLIKMPKIYFYDTGVAASLLGIRTEEQMEIHFARGELFENLVILEAMKARFNAGLVPSQYFWRDSTGREVDLLDEWDGTTSAFEAKASMTAHPNDANNLDDLAKLIPTLQRYIVLGGPQKGAVANTTLITPNEIEKVLEWKP
ncbi:MAG: uncharacterized protein QG632_717 [Candidatus Dependentiae bacterium]|nr:uncharacterized protein [Candidatus Dependentiae bacterium]